MRTEAMPGWTASDADFRRVIEEQNPWQESGAVPNVLAPATERPLVDGLIARLQRPAPHRYQLILGPRRVGKTTAMYQCVKGLMRHGVPANRLWWFRLDHPLLMGVPLDRIVKSLAPLARAEAPVFVFLDELVYAARWDLWLKSLYDDRAPVRILATSSATAALRRGRVESGVGRWEEQYLAPYLLPEYLALADDPVEIAVEDTLAHTLRSLAGERRPHIDVATKRQRLLIGGGFPELLMLEGVRDEADAMLESQRILRSDAVERAVYKDIPQSFGVDNPIMLERLLYVLAGQIAGILSPTRLCRELGFTQPTFDRYLSYLQQAFLVFALPNFSGRETSVQRRGRKLYFVDGAVRNAALQRGLAPLSRPEEMGLLLENMAAAHLHALSMQSAVRLHHWRDGSKEVDLVYDHPTDPVAVEVASGRHARVGLRAFGERFPRFSRNCYVVAPGARPVPPDAAEDGIGTLPLDSFLIAVGLQAAAATRARLAGSP